jgi:predicted RND superfamily exporter protein
MKDASSESMTTLRELQEQDIITDYSATILAPSMEEAEQMAVELEALELVTEVRTPSSYVPENQEEKIFVLEDAAFFLESVLYPEPPKPTPTPAERKAAVENLRAEIAALPLGDESDPARAATRRLGAALERVVATSDPEASVAELEQLVVSDLEERVEWLRTAIGVQGVGFEDLPTNLRERLVAANGKVRVVALPTEDLSQVENLIAFVDAVQALHPEATGRPAVEAGIGDIVVDTFRTALSIAVVLVGLILLIVLRNPLDALVVLLPITLAAFLTIAFGVVIGMSLNMANVVVVPLVIGLGVDNGVHVFMRFRQGGNLEHMMESSTPRAVMLSALTTLAAFGSLSLSGHWGIHSMGVLLSFAVISMTVCTLIVLPAMIMLLQRVRGTQPS